jgi:hypothetical protein
MKTATLALVVLLTATSAGFATPVPPPPSDVVAYVVGAAAVLTWDPAPTSDVVLYDVFVETDNTFVLVGTTAAPNFVVPGTYEGYGVSATALDGTRSTISRASCLSVYATPPGAGIDPSSCAGGAPAPSHTLPKSELVANADLL